MPQDPFGVQNARWLSALANKSTGCLKVFEGLSRVVKGLGLGLGLGLLYTTGCKGLGFGIATSIATKTVLCVTILRTIPIIPVIR